MMKGGGGSFIAGPFRFSHALGGGGGAKKVSTPLKRGGGGGGA